MHSLTASARTHWLTEWWRSMQSNLKGFLQPLANTTVTLHDWLHLCIWQDRCNYRGVSVSGDSASGLDNRLGAWEEISDLWRVRRCCLHSYTQSRFRVVRGNDSGKRYTHTGMLLPSLLQLSPWCWAATHPNDDKYIIALECCRDSSHRQSSHDETCAVLEDGINTLLCFYWYRMRVNPSYTWRLL